MPTSQAHLVERQPRRDRHCADGRDHCRVGPGREATRNQCAPHDVVRAETHHERGDRDEVGATSGDGVRVDGQSFKNVSSAVESASVQPFGCSSAAQALTKALR